MYQWFCKFHLCQLLSCVCHWGGVEQDTESGLQHALESNLTKSWGNQSLAHLGFDLQGQCSLHSVLYCGKCVCSQLVGSQMTGVCLEFGDTVLHAQSDMAFLHFPGKRDRELLGPSWGRVAKAASSRSGALCAHPGDTAREVVQSSGLVGQSKCKDG